MNKSSASALLKALLIVLALWVPSRGYAQSETVVDYVILVDVSKSMTGWGGNTVIFPQVKASLIQRIRQLAFGQTILIQPFADGLLDAGHFTIRRDDDRQAAIDFVEGLQATGSNTHIYASLAATFERYRNFRDNQQNRVAAVFVYTDGLDNGREHRTMRDMVREFGLRRQPYDHLYYVTLGVRLPNDDRAAFDGVEYASYDETPKGQVHDYVVVQPRYPALEFGNLKLEPSTHMEERFNIQGRLPGGLKLSASAVFPALDRQNGAAAELVPDSVNPLHPVQFGFELVNARVLRPQRYTGYIQFRSPEPWVLVIPSSVPAYFAYEPQRYVEVVHEGARLPALRPRELDPFRSRLHRDSARDQLPLAYDAITRSSGGYFRVRVEQSGRSPQRLSAAAIRLNGVPGLEHRLDAQQARELQFGVQATAKNVQPGRYEGVLILEPGDISIAGPDTVPWRVDVADKPMPLLLKVAIWAALLAAVAGLVRLSRPRLHGRLVVERGLNPGGGIFLGSEARVYLGPDATPVQPEDAVLTLHARGLRWIPRVAAIATPDVTLVRAPDNIEMPADSEELQEGDLLRLGSGVHLRYTLN